MQDGLRYTGSMLGVALPAPVVRALWIATRVLRTGLWGLLALLVWGAALAHAESEDDSRARSHFVAAQSYFEGERYPEAAREFGEAYTLSGRPEMLVNKSRAEERSGAVAEAVASLELLLTRHPQTSYREAAEAKLSELRPLLPPPAATDEPAKPVHVEVAPAPPPPRDSSFYWPRKPLTLVAAGATGASLIVAIATGWAAHAKYNDLEGRCDGGCEDPWLDDRQRGRRLARTSTGFTFATLALAGVTTALYIFELRNRPGQAQLAMRSSPSSCEAHLSLSF